jgi:uncharacterized Fe-S center protein
MKSTVYFGSARQGRLVAGETLPAKLDLIMERLNIQDRVKDESVAIKLHVGGNIGYSVIHPVFVRKVVQAVKDGGGHPFVTDVGWNVASATERGYTPEVLGCPVLPTSGMDDKYHYTHKREYKNIKEWKVAGMIQDASFMINFAHVKGHPSCGFGAGFKNIALGCMVGETRRQIHDTNHFDPYWFGEFCPDEAVRQKIKEACPFQALVDDQENPNAIHVHFEPCNQCGRCLKVAPLGSLKIDPVNFYSFQEANAISVSVTLSTFAPDKTVHMALATHMTPMCDCFGFTSMPILPDVGIFGSNDLVALDQSVLDKIAESKLIMENVPTAMEPWYTGGHPFQHLHGPYKDPYKVVEYGEKLGLGSRQYELVDVLPVEEVARGPLEYISAT